VSGDSIFAGTKCGVFLSTNNGTSWTTVDSGIANIGVTTLCVAGDGSLLAGTSGLGVWRKSSPVVSGVINYKSTPHDYLQQANFRIIPLSYSVSIAFSLLHSEQVSVKVYNLSGYETASLVNKNFTAGSHCVKWGTKNNAPGCYIIRMNAGADSYVKSVSIYK
jgi:hypothetical protein